MFEYVTYLNADTLMTFLNAVAAICSSPDYRTLLKVAALLGILGAAASFIWTSKLTPMIQSLAGTVVVSSVLLMPTSITVVNRMATGGAGTVVQQQVIDNVPFGLAAPISIINKIGDWLTRTYETALTDLDPSVSFQTAGYGFYSTALRTILSENIGNNYSLSSNLRQFFNACVVPDLAGDPAMMDSFLNSPDKWTEMVVAPAAGGDPYSNPARFVSIFNPNAPATASNMIAMQCSRDGRPNDPDTAYGVINAQMNAYLNTHESELARWLNPDLSNTVDKNALFDTQVSSITEHLTGQTFTTRALVRNSMLNNVYMGELMRKGSPAEYSAAVASLAAKKQTWAQSFNAKRFIPLIKNIITCLIIMMTPIFLLLMLFKGAEFYTYLLLMFKILFALELFAPLGAIANYIQTHYMISQTNLLGLPAISNYGRYWEITSTQESMGAAIWLIIPALAWLITSGTGSIASMAMGMMAPSNSSAGSSAGNTSVDAGSFAGKFTDPQGTAVAMRWDNSNIDGTMRNASTKGVLTTGGKEMDYSYQMNSGIQSTAKSASSLNTGKSTRGSQNQEASFDSREGVDFKNSQTAGDSQRWSTGSRAGTENGAGRELANSLSSGVDVGQNFDASSTIGYGSKLSGSVSGGSGGSGGGASGKLGGDFGLENNMTARRQEGFKNSDKSDEKQSHRSNTSYGTLADSIQSFETAKRSNLDQSKGAGASQRNSTGLSEDQSVAKTDSNQFEQSASQSSGMSFTIRDNAGHYPQYGAQLAAINGALSHGDFAKANQLTDELKQQIMADHGQPMTSPNQNVQQTMNQGGKNLSTDYDQQSQQLKASQQGAMKEQHARDHHAVEQFGAQQQGNLPQADQSPVVQNANSTIDSNQAAIDQRKTMIETKQNANEQKVDRNTQADDGQTWKATKAAKNNLFGNPLSGEKEDK